MVERPASTRPPARAARSSRSTRRPASCCGCTARTKARAAPTRRGSSPAAAWRTGPTAARNASSTSRPATGWSRSTRRPGAIVTGFGDNGIVDLKQDDDQEIDLDHRRGRPARDAGRREGRRHRRRRAPVRRRAARHDEREGLRPRLRRAHRQAAVDLPHHSAARRVRQRHLGEGLVVLHRQHRRVGADLGRRRARASRICRSNCRPATTTAAIVPATACSARASSRSI